MAKVIVSSYLSFNDSLKLLKRLMCYFKPYKVKITFAVFWMLLVASCTAFTAYLVKPAMDDIFIKGDTTALIYIPLLFIFITVIKGLGRYYQNYLMHFCGLRVLETLRDELYQKIIFLPVRFFEDNQVGMLMSRIINDVVMIRSSLPGIIMLIRESLTMLGLMAVVIYQDFSLAIWAILVLPLALVPFIYFGKTLRKLGRKSQVKLADVSIFLQEIFSGIRVVKAFSTETKESIRFAKENDRIVQIALKQVKASEMSSPVMEVVGALGLGLVMWYGGKQVIAGISTPGTFFSFIAALAMMYDPIKKLTGANNDVQRALAGAERVFEILDSMDIVEEKGGDKELTLPFESLEFKNITFAYSKEALPALNEINFSVKQGERVAIVGPSGAGKTTFVNLIPRFYEAQQGEIYINNCNIKEYTLSSLRKYIALVSQDTFLFNTSIKENIAYGTNEFNQEKLFMAAKQAYTHDFIMEMPDGYDTIVGERGVKISGGQKQRIAIARAIFKDAPFLILDEATSALDSESERCVQLALENLMQNRTSIVIAHRLSTILNADRILVMDNGKIISVGKHEDLLSTSPLYAKLYSLQFEI